MKKLTSFLSMIALGSTFAVADVGRNMDDAFKKMDVNADGKLTIEELNTGKDADKAAESFRDHDDNKDGFVTLEEYKGGKATAGKQYLDNGTAKPATKDGDPGKKDSDSGETKAHPNK